MKRKLAALCALSLTATMLLTGCGSSDSGEKKEDSSAESTELTMFWGSGQSQESTDHIKTVISEFEEKNPDIKFNLSIVSDPEGQVKQQMAAGGGPDIVNTDTTSMQIFASSGYLVPLDEYAEQYKWSERFDQWVLDTLSYDGQWYGLPKEMVGLVVYYNESMFKENGWEIPTTYDELVKLCEEMTAKDILPFTFGSSDYKQANQWWVSQLFSAGMGQEDLHKLLQGEMDWTSDEVRTTVENFVNLWENNYIYQDFAAITMDEARNLFTSGKAGMFMSGTWEVSPIEEADPDFEWNIYQMPSWRDDAPSVLPVALDGSYSINTKCENPDAAAKFLDYVYQKDVAVRMHQFGTLYPLNDLDTSSVDAPEKVKLLQNFLDDSLATGKIGYCAWTYWPANTDTYAWNNIESVCMGQISIDEYLEKLQENFKVDEEKGNVLEF